MVVFIRFYDNQAQLEYAAKSCSPSQTYNANLAKCKFLCTFFFFLHDTKALSSGGWKAIFITIFYGYYIDEIFMITNGRL
jgi:hypothetical protein